MGLKWRARFLSSFLFSLSSRGKAPCGLSEGRGGGADRVGPTTDEGNIWILVITGNRPLKCPCNILHVLENSLQISLNIMAGIIRFSGFISLYLVFDMREIGLDLINHFEK